MPMENFVSVKVNDLMTKKAVSVGATMTASEVARLIVKLRLRGSL